MWISCKGLQDNPRNLEFPYSALCPSSGKKGEFLSIEDVNEEIIKLYDVATDKGYDLGESLFIETLFFTDHRLLINNDMQSTISAYQFCQKFNCPPAESLDKVPADIFDDFMIIDEEYNKFLISNQKKV